MCLWCVYVCVCVRWTGIAFVRPLFDGQKEWKRCESIEGLFYHHYYRIICFFLHGSSSYFIVYSESMMTINGSNSNSIILTIIIDLYFYDNFNTILCFHAVFGEVTMIKEPNWAWACYYRNEIWIFAVVAVGHHKRVKRCEWLMMVTRFQRRKRNNLLVL